MFKTRDEQIVAGYLEVVSKQAKNAIELLDQDKMTEMYLSEKQLAVWQALQGSGLLSRSQVQSIAQIPSPTVRQALLKLIGEAVGQGKATKYRVKGK